MKIGIVVFPGSNCDHDTYWAVRESMGSKSTFIWHRDTDINEFDGIFLPGGFSYGDYLRSGAIARFSPVMEEVVKFADSGKPVIGICNGFQILTESGLLPGALAPNDNLKFVCKSVNLKVQSRKAPWLNHYMDNEILKMPIAHGEGRYVASEDIIKQLEDEDRIAFRYCDENGEITLESNPNGSVSNIAGILNKNGNVLGMMPHPERATERILGGTDGKKLFDSLMEVVA
ncbi:MAG: phosphoribosylformylglycinamidine synthase subunit PurQ [Candidatus Marinimicrobia bacterium]|nr:phosphoribosylformylglycinamidine synthase subunit PurQ [Candidatus Neomarinimicrobiota bacterium]